MPLHAAVAHYRLGDRSGVWLLDQVRSIQPKAQRILVADDPRIDSDRLRLHGIVHSCLPSGFLPARLADALGGVPDSLPVETTPIVSVPASDGRIYR